MTWNDYRLEYKIKDNKMKLRKEYRPTPGTKAGHGSKGQKVLTIKGYVAVDHPISNGTLKMKNGYCPKCRKTCRLKVKSDLVSEGDASAKSFGAGVVLGTLGALFGASPIFAGGNSKGKEATYQHLKCTVCNSKWNDPDCPPIVVEP
jgi:hypothetical protein